MKAVTVMVQPADEVRLRQLAAQRGGSVQKYLHDAISEKLQRDGQTPLA